MEWNGTNAHFSALIPRLSSRAGRYDWTEQSWRDLVHFEIFATNGTFNDGQLNYKQLVQDAPRIGNDGECWLSTAQLFRILRELNGVIETVFRDKGPEFDLPQFLILYGRTLKSHFIDKVSFLFPSSSWMFPASSILLSLCIHGALYDPKHQTGWIGFLKRDF